MMNNQDNSYLKVRTDHRQILSIALPISLSIIVPQLNLLLNSIFLGHLSQEALGNAGVTGVFYMVFSVAGFGMNNALQSLLSSYAGGGKTALFNKGLTQGIRISLILATCFMMLVWLFSGPLLASISSANAATEETTFIHIRILGLPFLFLFQLGNAVLISTLNSRKLMIGFFAQAFTNIVLDYLLIFGKAGFPALGFNGAAWASVISEAVGMFSVFAVIKFSGIQQRFKLFSDLGFDRAIFYRLSKIAAPLILQYIISLATWLVFFIVIEPHGETAKAISNCMRNVFGTAGVFVWAFSGTCNTMVANLIGQDDKKSIIPLITRITYWSFSLCLMMVILLNVFPVTFFSFFGQTEQFIHEGIPVIRIVSLGMLFMSVANVWLNGLTGIGDTKINLIIEILAILLYLIYTWYFTVHHYTTLAMAWSNEIIYWLTIFIFSFGYIRSKKWMAETKS
jgi:putative MATE family efflux protein